MTSGYNLTIGLSDIVLLDSSVVDHFSVVNTNTLVIRESKFRDELINSEWRQKVWLSISITDNDFSHSDAFPHLTCGFSAVF